MNIKAYLGLEDRMTPTLSKAEKQAMDNIRTFNQLSKSVDDVKKSLDAAEKANPNIINTKAYQDAALGLEKMEMKLNGVASGEKLLQEETEKTTSKLGSFIAKVASFTALVTGAKFLMNMSDTYTQTHARLGMITEDVDNFEKQIYQSAQRSRVSYQSVADTVSKLGMQAGDAFNNSSEEVLAFSELLSKTFKTQGMDESSIASTMYNMTQSLSSGKLLGQDYRILKQNAPQILQYLRQFYGDISQAELDGLVTAGRVTAQDLKNAMFNATDDIEEKFKKMPVTFSDVWTKFQNTLQKILQPIAKILSKVADGLDTIVTFLSENEYILYAVAAAIAAVIAVIIAYNAATAIAAAVTAVLDLTMGGIAIIIGIVIVLLVALVVAMIYLWNTNDDVAEAMLYAWDNIRIGIKNAWTFIKFVWNMMQAGLYTLEAGVYAFANGALLAWQGLATGIQGIVSIIIHQVQNMVNKFIDGANSMIDIANLFGAGLDRKAHVTFAEDYDTKMLNDVKDRWAEIDKMATKAQNAGIKAKQISTSAWDNTLLDIAKAEAEYAELERTRKDRVANREKLTGEGVINAVKGALGLDDVLDNVTGADGHGGKAVKVTTDDRLLKDEDIQLLLDVATRDYKIDYQQITPNITLTFGDIRETADVDQILDEVADRLEEIYDADLEVNPV